MEILRGTPAFALLLPALVLGALRAQRAWRTRDAFTLLTLGAVVGLSTHLVALNALCYLLRPGLAAWSLAAQPVSMIWLAGGAGALGPDTRFELSVLGRDGHWTRTPKPVRMILSPTRPGTALLRFEPSSTPAVLLRVTGPARAKEGEMVPLTEVWVGAATEGPLAP